jgi:hypothetical protein
LNWWGYPDAEAEAIEAEVLKPHRDYQRKRQEYQDTLRECLERESPLSQRTITDLIDYRAHLQLSPEDMTTIEQSVLNDHGLEGYVAKLDYQQQAQVQLQAEVEQQQQKAEAERKQPVAFKAQSQQEEAERYKQSEEKAPRTTSIQTQINVVSSEGLPISHASITAIADNSTTKSAVTSPDGKAVIEILAGRSYHLLIAHPNYPGTLLEFWNPSDNLYQIRTAYPRFHKGQSVGTHSICPEESGVTKQDLVLEVILVKSKNIGSMICHSTCHIPGLEGRLNPILDTSNRTYLYADNIAINSGVQQPGKFTVNEPFELEDCNGVLIQVKVLFIQGRTSLLQYVNTN